MLSKICLTCENMFHRWKRYKVFEPPLTHHNYADLSTAANHGCEVCILILAQIRDEGVEDIDPSILNEPLVIRGAESGDASSVIYLCIWSGSSERRLAALSLTPACGMYCLS